MPKAGWERRRGDGDGEKIAFHLAKYQSLESQIFALRSAFVEEVIMQHFQDFKAPTRHHHMQVRSSAHFRLATGANRAAAYKPRTGDSQGLRFRRSVGRDT
jgi:hypothetical protein